MNKSVWIPKIVSFLVLSFVMNTVTAPRTAQAGEAAGFYAGEVIRLIVGYGPGGGYDAYARFLAPHLQARTGATVIVENRPGGGGLLALNQVVAARPDGLSIMLANAEAAALAQLLDKEGVRYDLQDVTWLARVSTEPRVLMWSRRSELRNLADGMQSARRINWAASGKTDSIADVTSFASAALNLNSRIIIGYKGSKEAALAATRGEVDGICVSASSAKKYAGSGKLLPVTVLGRERSTLFPKLPTVFELVKLPPDKAWLIDYRSQLTGLGRALLTAPGVPAERAGFLRAALDSILSDPEIQAEARAIGRLLNHATANRLTTLIDDTLTSLDSQTLQLLRNVVLERYY